MKFTLKYKIFSVLFAIQLLVVALFIFAFVKSFKESKLTSSYEENAHAISEFKSNVDSRIFSLLDKIKSITGVVVQNKLEPQSILPTIGIESRKNVLAAYHFKSDGADPSAFLKLQQVNKGNFPDLDNYLKQFYQSTKDKSINIWNFEWNNKSYTGLSYYLSFDLTDQMQAKQESHYFFFLLNTNDLFQSKNSKYLSDTVVFNKQGQLIYTDSSMDKGEVKNIFKTSGVQNSIQNKNLIQVSEVKLGKYSYLLSTQYQAVGEIVIATMIQTEQAFQGVNQVYLQAIYLTLFSVFISYVLATLFSSTITKPITHLAEQMQNISKGNLDINVDVRSNDEIGILSLNFKQMTADLKKSKSELVALNQDLEQKVIDRTKELEELTIKDALTGAYNRRYFDQRILEELQRAKRANKEVGLLYLDIDHFKKYNDQNGHPEGDQLLIDFVQTVKAKTRESNFFCRLGGEEFCVIVVDTNEEGLRAFAEIVRTTVFEKDFKFGEKQPMGRLTCSIGVSMYPHHALDADGLVKAADQALYISKQSGRNQWRMADKPTSAQVDQILESINSKKVS